LETGRHDGRRAQQQRSRVASFRWGQVRRSQFFSRIHRPSSEKSPAPSSGERHGRRGLRPSSGIARLDPRLHSTKDVDCKRHKKSVEVL